MLEIQFKGRFTIRPRRGELHFELQLTAYVFSGQAPAQGETHRLDSGHTNKEKNWFTEPMISVIFHTSNLNNEGSMNYVLLTELQLQLTVVKQFVTYPGIFSISLCTGMVSCPRKRLMIGRLFANLSFTSMYRMSVISATKVYFCREAKAHTVNTFSVEYW